MPRTKPSAKRIVNEFLIMFLVAAAIQWRKMPHGASVGSVLAAAFPTALGAMIGLQFVNFASWRHYCLFGGAFALCILVQWPHIQHGEPLSRILLIAAGAAFAATWAGILLASLWRKAEGETPAAGL